MLTKTFLQPDCYKGLFAKAKGEVCLFLFCGSPSISLSTGKVSDLGGSIEQPAGTVTFCFGKYKKNTEMWNSCLERRSISSSDVEARR